MVNSAMCEWTVHSELDKKLEGTHHSHVKITKTEGRDEKQSEISKCQ